MQTQREEIRRILEENGWRVLEDDSDYSSCWWVAEDWKVESVWSPQGFTFWLTFWVDDMMPHPYQEPKDKYVWAAIATSNLNDKRIFLTLGKGWKKRVPKFLSELSRLRQEAGANTVEKIS